MVIRLESYTASHHLHLVETMHNGSHTSAQKRQLQVLGV